MLVVFLGHHVSVFSLLQISKRFPPKNKFALNLTSKTALKLAWGRGKGDGTIPNYLSHCTMAQDLN